MKKTTLLALTLVLLSGCSKKDSPTSAPAPSSSSSLAVEESYADLRGPLVLCVDFKGSVVPIAHSVETTMPKASKLPKACSAHFASKTELASCDQTRSDDVHVLMHFYDFQALADEALATQCNQAGGRWKSVARETEAFTRAKKEYEERVRDAR